LILKLITGRLIESGLLINLLKSSGYRVETFPDLNYYNLSENKWFFDWNEWLQLIEEHSEELPSLNNFTKIDYSKFKPIDFQILRELTKNPGIKQAELMRKFNLSRTNIHQMYNSIFHKLISSVRSRIDRIMFNLVNTRVFWISKPEKKKMKQLYNLIEESPPPFRLGFDIFEDQGFLLWGGGLPSFHEHELAHTIWNLFPSFKSYTLDTSVDRSTIYWFYPDNFDFKTHYWKIDREWIIDKPLEELERVKTFQEK
jgi:hypothetical protein